MEWPTKILSPEKQWIFLLWLYLALVQLFGVESGFSPVRNEHLGLFTHVFCSWNVPTVVFIGYDQVYVWSSPISNYNLLLGSGVCVSNQYHDWYGIVSSCPELASWLVLYWIWTIRGLWWESTATSPHCRLVAGLKPADDSGRSSPSWKSQKCP